MNLNHIENAQRHTVVTLAKSWLKTPYHHGQGVKGAGVDCAYLLIEVYSAAGLAPRINPGPYPRDWHFHRGDERYLEWIERFASPLLSGPPLPGDVATFKFGRSHAHGAIVTDWPNVIHAYYKTGSVIESNIEEASILKARLGPLYRLNIWER